MLPLQKSKTDHKQAIRGLVLSSIPNFHHVLNAVCFLLCNSSASEFCMPTLLNALFHPHRQVGMKNGWG